MDTFENKKMDGNILIIIYIFLFELTYKHSNNKQKLN